MRISDWSSDVCSSDLKWGIRRHVERRQNPRRQARAKAYKLADAHSSISMCRPGLEALSHEAGAIDKRILREFDEACLALATRSSPMRSKPRSEEHTSEIQSLMRLSAAVFCLKKKKK